MLRVIEGRKIAPETMTLYPTMDSLVEAVAYIEAQCPVDAPNKLFPLLMMYHNTLIKELNSSMVTAH